MIRVNVTTDQIHVLIQYKIYPLHNLLHSRLGLHNCISNIVLPSRQKLHKCPKFPQTPQVYKGFLRLFCGEGLLLLQLTTSRRITSCRLSGTAYSMHSQLSPWFESFSSVRNWGRSVLCWQGALCIQHNDNNRLSKVAERFGSSQLEDPHIACFSVLTQQARKITRIEKSIHSAVIRANFDHSVDLQGFIVLCISNLRL
jgi:hypothetical protein